MSILLDALKKSEAQRQLGATPTLHSNMDGGAAETGHGMTWVAAVMLLLAAGTIGWLGWKQFRAPEVMDQLVQQSVATPSTAGAVPATMEPQGGQQETALDSPVKSFSQAAPVAEPATRRRSSGKDVEELRQKLGTSVKSYSAADEPQSSGSRPAQTGTEALSPASELAAAVSAENEAGPSPDSRQPAAAEAPSEGIDTNIISYWQLPQSIRDRMPEMRITVLVFADNPDDRFVLMNGQRLRENDELEGGVLLEEIQRTRAIFSYRNYRFHVKS